MRINKYFLIVYFLLVSCGNTLDRLSELGQPPKFATVQYPALAENQYMPIQQLEQNQKENYINPPNHNSLWRAGSRSFFRDQRARRVGDILKINIKIRNNASLDNRTEKSRNNHENSGVNNLLGFEEKLGKFLPGINPASLVDLTGSNNYVGSGKIARKEDVQTEIAAMVNKILPNGNLVIQGHQEVRINHELREITVTGIVRPEDISADNSINTDQLAEARISYGGRGVVSDVQQPRLGNQIIDLVSPF